MNTIKTLLSLILWWPIQLIAKIVLVIAGIFLVPFIINQLNECDIFSTHEIKHNPKIKFFRWWLRTLPKEHALWLFANDRDGSLGDRYGHYAQDWLKLPWAKWFPVKGKFYQYWWLAIRNPAKNLGFVKWNACDIRNCTFKTYGSNHQANNSQYGKGWQFTIGKNKEDRLYFGFTAWLPYTSKVSSRGLLIKLGNKIDGRSKIRVYPAGAELKYLKGTAFYANPFQNS